VAVLAGGLRMSPLILARRDSLNFGLPRIIEMQIIAATLLENFEFSLPPQIQETRIIRKPLVVMVPMVEGRLYPWMGLKVKYLD
jgi:hypothetical protein